MCKTSDVLKDCDVLLPIFNQKMFQKFLNNGKVSLCGSQVFVLVKRYPDESDVSDIISQLRANHVMVYIAVNSVPSGGSNSATLYEISYQTNGYSAFGDAGLDFVRFFTKLVLLITMTSVTFFFLSVIEFREIPTAFKISFPTFVSSDFLISAFRIFCQIFRKFWDFRMFPSL